jgi:endoglucanase
MLRSIVCGAVSAFTWLACATSEQGSAPASPPIEAEPNALMNVRVDQHGYVPTANKIAVWVSAATSAAPFELVDAAGQVVAGGTTTPFGTDAESGDTLQIVDFSAFAGQGRGYRLRVGQDSSHPFDISAGLYASLYEDAARYFYLNRSGVPLEMPHVRDPSLARPAGHLSDRRVPCLPDSGCSHALDVSGGWYDAGDYGKYVVNGGVATWLLLNAYELAAVRKRGEWFADGQLGIPESQNGSPDLLDEARVEIAFLLKMQVPAGEPLAGMVHHKIHDERWSALGKAPTPQTELARYLHPPSTAATLNLAAVAAVAARLYASIDPGFARGCLDAARRAFAAARVNPGRLAPLSKAKGGGPYPDEQLADDFYWAAAELFVSTREPTFAEFIRSSPYFRSFSASADGVPASFDWATTDVLGSLSLILHGDLLAPEEVATLKDQVRSHADRSLAQIQKQGYRFPMTSEGTTMPWGSNWFVTNNGIVLGFAHALTNERKYLEGAYEALHYVLGRNPNDFSYVSGYGERALRHPHHRFWAKSIDPQLPSPPPGALAGGPNSRSQGALAKAKREGCKPLKCYADEVPLATMNEVAINWNASLTWLAAYLAQQ